MTIHQNFATSALQHGHRMARLEITDSEVVGNAVLSFVAREIAAPYQEFRDELILEDEKPDVAGAGQAALWDLCQAIGRNDVPADSEDLHFRDFAAFVTGDRIDRFIDRADALA